MTEKDMRYMYCKLFKILVSLVQVLTIQYFMKVAILVQSPYVNLNHKCEKDRSLENTMKLTKQT